MERGARARLGAAHSPSGRIGAAGRRHRCAQPAGHRKQRLCSDITPPPLTCRRTRWTRADPTEKQHRLRATGIVVERPRRLAL